MLKYEKDDILWQVNCILSACGHKCETCAFKENFDICKAEKIKRMLSETK